MPVWQDSRSPIPAPPTPRRATSPILALNARTETIRQVARSGGVDRLDAAVRRELPAEIQLKDPAYEKYLNQQMMVHMSASPERLRPMVEAQIARDEAMAATLASFLQSAAGKGRTAVFTDGRLTLQAQEGPFTGAPADAGLFARATPYRVFGSGAGRPSAEDALLGTVGEQAPLPADSILASKDDA